ncbi:type II toxin-antitoxin system Y4mF family antitoxin [Luteimonas sp. MC1895]|uniref:type II toxin-antitoxin system Y4mF family antitoxin n=1 Tax=Luteimonas sp. MC1895 TaxID=2819513 RepID=UPI0018F10041|nr:type II toxin-antitoxin system Y4mF family antitoxin [Luteimonas sp. MC1895]MBJ6978090.1 helix-turn-helix transcriptional regulator [Luteimonas sp. MC1895]
MSNVHSPSGIPLELSDTPSLGKAVRTARKTHGLTQTELAGLAGTGPRFISDLERGKPTVEAGKVLDVLSVLGLRLLLAGVGE